jgi:2',3'-cyclic-nucleotide 2'-phosphodiesterase/3'-nucleotidase
MRTDAQGGEPSHFDLRILATTDLHATILPFDYVRDEPRSGTGLAGLARMIDAERADCPNTLLFDNGDLLQGSPLGDLSATVHMSGTENPVIAAMNALGYDGATVGNHDFDFGLGYLRGALARAAYPVVCANLRTGQSGAEEFAPFILLERTLQNRHGITAPIRIGVLGFAPPAGLHDPTVGSAPILVGDIVEHARELVPLIRENGADIVVALAHTGFGAPDHIQGSENAGHPLSRVPGIDALILGHTHKTFPVETTGGVGAHTGLLGKATVMPGAFGSHLGIIDLALSRAGGAWSVRQSSARLRSATASGMPDPSPVAPSQGRVEAACALAHSETRRLLRREVATTTRPLCTALSLVGTSSALGLIAGAKAAFVKAALASGPYSGLPVLAVASPYKAGGRGGPDNYVTIRAGDVLMRHVFDLYPFPNRIRAVLVDGRGLLQMLEQSAAIFAQVAAGKHDQPLIDPDQPAYEFDTIYGLSYVVDPTQPAWPAPDWGRILEFRYNGRPVAPDDRFILATNSHRVGLRPSPNWLSIALETDDLVRDIVAAHLTAQGVPDSAGERVWSFASHPGTSAWFDTSPSAEQLLPEMLGARLRGTQITPEGFLRVSLSL